MFVQKWFDVWNVSNKNNKLCLIIPTIIIMKMGLLLFWRDWLINFKIILKKYFQQQSIENKKKRISPPFSALELASSPGEMFGGTKRTRVESEH